MDTYIVITILICALIIAFVFYKSWKNRKKAKADQTVFLDSLQDKMAVISNALAEINVNGKWEVTKEKEEATMSFQYQGGYFSFEISKKGNTARIVYPFFYSKSIVDILSLRTFINKINQSCGLAEVVYSCDTDKAEADLHIIVGLAITSALNGDVLMLYLNDIFSCRNMVMSEVEEVCRYNRKGHYSDFEESFVKESYANKLLSEGEIKTQDAPKQAHYTPSQRPLLGNILRDTLGIKPHEVLSLMVTHGDKTVEEVAHYSIMDYDLTLPLIKDKKFKGQQAQATLLYKEDGDNKPARMVSIAMMSRSSDNEALYIRMSMTLLPQRIQPLHPACDEEATKPKSVVFTIAYDLMEETQIKAKFTYLWKEVVATKKEGGTMPDDIHQALLWEAFSEQEAYLYYQGTRFFYQKRYAEALPWLNSAYDILKEQLKHEKSKDLYSFFELCYLLGCSYYILRQFKMACYFLGMINGLQWGRFQRDYAYALVMADDVRAMSYIDSRINDLEGEISMDTGDDDDDDDDSILPSDNLDDKKESLKMLTCLKAHLLVNIYHFDEAEALLQQLVKQPNNKRAVEELERLRKERKRKEDQDLNDMINGNIKPADDDMPM